MAKTVHMTTAYMGWSDHHHMRQGARKGKLNNWYSLTFGIALDVSNIAYNTTIHITFPPIPK